jgi:hypothetical protein
MSFYEFSKAERDQLVAAIHEEIYHDMAHSQDNSLVKYFSDEGHLCPKGGLSSNR